MRSNRTAPRCNAGFCVAVAIALVGAGCQARLEVPAPPPQAQLHVSTANVAPGQRIEFQASGFGPGQDVEIGFGQPDADYTVVARGRTDGRGQLSGTVTIPEWARGGEVHVLLVAAAAFEPSAVSEPFLVAAPGDRIEVRGTLTDEGVECPAMRDRHGTLYTLGVTDLPYPPGTEVLVTGTLPQVSICMQGITIQVESLEVL